MSTNPQVQNLELRAMEQRNQLHQTVAEIKQKVSDVREKFDIKKKVQRQVTEIKHDLDRHKMATALIASAVTVITSIFIARSFDR
jgi:septal ring factor EnvC (AmiA/AmiB activator)